jgi:hypothetical protein
MRRIPQGRFSIVVRLTVAALLWIGLGTPRAWAQVESGSIVGTIRDASGAAVDSAAVTVTNTATNIASRVSSNSVGEYTVTQLKPGNYTVTVEKEGFKKAVQTAFKLDVNQIVRVDIALTVGTIHEEMLVTAAEPLVESETSSIGQVIEQSRVNDLPLNGRNFIQLAYLSPGVNAGPEGIVQQGGIPENERGNGAIQANGLMATNNNFLLNGFDNNEQQIGFEVIQPAVDAIQEFKVQTSNFGADIGKGGAVVNVVLKSGSNQFHGGAYDFLRNSALDAKNYFDTSSGPNPPFKQNQFGGTFGGPILRNKTFFFADYQGTRIRQAETSISLVPLASEKGGNFTDLLTGTSFSACPNAVAGDPVFDTGTIFDPLSTHTFTCGDGTPIQLRNPVQSNSQINVIPPCVGSTGLSGTGGACLDPAALDVINLYPAPNAPEFGAQAFRFNPAFRNNQDSFDVRLDHQLTSKDSLFGSFSFGNVDSHHPDPFPGKAGGGAFSGQIRNKARALGISDVHTFSPAKISEFKVGYSRYEVNAIQNFANEAVSTELGVPGINDPNNLIATGGLTNINIGGLTSLGNICCFPEFLRENNYQVLDSFTYIRGRHTWKVGADLRLRRHGFFQALNPTGTLNFDQQFTDDLTTSNGGGALATFLLGYPSFAARDGQKQPYGMSWWEFSTYAMDDFRVSPRLTLNLGVRYDLFTPMVEDKNRLANFDFSTGTFIAPGTPGVSRSGNLRKDLNNFAPRVGFAYTPWSDNKTTFRGGFGIFYDLQANQNDTELAYNPTGLFFSQSVNAPATTTAPPFRLSTGFPTPDYPTIRNPSGRTSAAYFNNRTTYIEEWNFNLERELVRNMVLQLAYVGTHALKLAFLSNLNQPVQPSDSNFTDATGNLGRPYFSMVPNVGPIRTETHQYNSSANALQVRLEKRMSAGWTMLNSYTWQHTLGQAEENEWTEPQNTHNLAGERGDNGPDYRHQFTSAWSYELPFGPGKRFFNGGGWSRWVAGGWQVNGIVGLYTGAAFTPLLSFDPTNTGSGGPRPDIISNPYVAGPVKSNSDPACHFTISQGGRAADKVHTLTTWFNPCAFDLPANAAVRGITQNARVFGNARRGSLRGPASHNVDFSVFKDFPLRERLKVQFRAEFFNFFNTPNFTLPQNGVDVAGAGAILGANASREIQFGLKLSF